ncbi:MAG: hypothetical protein HZC45_04205, partial [Deltaproteobacteria bacterium]|nr:hypothetical protein [Deltaproteobacteria bacterium]
IAVVEISNLFSADLSCILMPDDSNDTLKIIAIEPQTQLCRDFINLKE